MLCIAIHEATVDDASCHSMLECLSGPHERSSIWHSNSHTQLKRQAVLVHADRQAYVLVLASSQTVLKAKTIH